MLASLQRRLCELKVRLGCRSDDDDVYLVVGEQLVGRAVDGDVGMASCGIVVCGRLALHDRVQLE